MTGRRSRRRILLGLTIVALAASAIAGRIVHPSTAGGLRSSTRAMSLCGTERWEVKTLTDSQARLVNFHPHATTVSALRRFRPTGSYRRGRGVERRTYRVKARLVEAKFENDQDIHLVIADLRHPSQTMIVEFPASNCVRHAGPKRRRQMVQARKNLIAACGHPSATDFSSLRGTALVTGVGFFDSIHGQTGVAPNGIELHPVLGFGHTRCGYRRSA
jgi:hypothetical protein